MSNKKTICLITNWYPSKQNPQEGLFFKEQALAMEGIFDFLVIHYHERKRALALEYFFRKIFRKTYKITDLGTERNITEIDLDARFPAYTIVADEITSVYKKEFLHISKQGVGRYVSTSYRNRKNRVLARIFKKHFDGKIDALYCVDAQREADTLWCISKALKIPYVVGEHGPVPWVGRVIDDMNHEAIEQADLFLTISNDKLRQLLMQNLHIKRVKYIGNLVDENVFKLKENDTDVKTFIIIAAHSFYKNYDMFIEIMNRLSDMAQNPFKVMIVGYNANKGYSQDADIFEEQIRQSKFAEFAEMIPSIPHDKMPELLNRADAFIMTSIQEGQPVSAMEAACCGLPIFSTRCGGVEDYVDEKSGRIFSINDVEGFAETLNDYLEGRLTFDSLYIRNNVVSRFGRDAFRNNFEDAFNSVIDGKC